MNKFMVVSALFLSGAAVFHHAAHAAGDADMNFRGTLIMPPPCTINDGNRIDVDFGDRLGINKVDGSNYRQPVNYQISCEGNNADGWALTLSLTGTPAGFDGTALQSSKEGLGIRLYQNNKPFTPNTTINVDQANPPRLEAVPVKQAGTNLDKGSFETWATLKADYQ